ncbi:hypothetical protein GN330_07260 [Nitratireductor sp. CAU 1489]|uniref:Uncharacterized protein n=1 Tax=Nitratireductor arenosus TaxID=2682096 RepID=A0A844QCR6_9HYPH|nr:hypothetical protein [Nitratireductor arenosus]MVA97045.1 hypothetical protein [Nitratireductor arenosus]
MFFRRTFLVAAIVAASATTAAADTYLGSYVARISGHDHEASDGYPLESAAQIVRQDRANYHKFGRIDAEDTGDSWFASAKARGRLQNMLERGGAMDSRTRRAIVNGSPLIEVEVYQRSVKVFLLR